MSSSLKRVSGFLLIALLTLAWTAGAWAQAGTGEVTGIVFDPSGAVIAKATITLNNDATGDVRKTETTPAGVYRFAALPIVGSYTLTVITPGFGEYKATGLAVSVGSVLTHDIHLKVGSSKEVVNVEGSGDVIQTTESQLSQLVDNRIWQNMPLETRNQNAFINLIAGAIPDTGSTRGASVNGARGGTGNYMVEGMDNNDQGQAGRGQLGNDEGGAATSISPDAIQEYRVITNSFAAEYGKAGGFVTDTVIKSGTNTFHGNLYEYNRVQALAANGWFSNRSIDSVTGKKVQDSLVRNQFGGSFGGPIKKDKTFFFANAEVHRMRQAQSLHAIATTQQFLDWVGSGGMAKWAESDPKGICNNAALMADEGLSRNAAPCLGAFSNSTKMGALFTKMKNIGPFPLTTSKPCGVNDPNCTAAGFYSYDSVFPVPAYGDLYISDPYHLDEYRITTKFDHRFTDRDNLNVSFMEQYATSGDPYQGGGNTIGPPSINDGRGVNLGINWNHTFSSTILNTFRASYLRHRSDFPSPGPEYDSMPQIYTWNDPMTVGLGLYGGLPQYFTDNQFQYQDHISIVKGKHNFKMGGEYRRIRNGSSFFNDRPGSFFPWSIEDLVSDLYFTDEAAKALGVPSPGSVYYASAAVDSTTGGLPVFYRGFRANEYAFYWQDDWRVSQRFSVNYGIRYEYFGPPHNFQPNIDSNFYFGSPIAPIATSSTNIFFPKTNPYYAKVATGSFQVRNHEIWGKDNNNWAPRLGFSWDIFGNQKLVMRAGGGVMYDRIYNNVFENIRFNPPYYSDLQLGYSVGGAVGALSSPGLYTYPFTSTRAFATGKGAVPNPRHMDQDLVMPYYEQIHYGFQSDLGKGFVFEPEYVGTFGHKLIGYYDINTFNGRVAKGQTTQRVNTNIGADNFRTNCCGSNYHGMQLSLRKKMSAGLAFDAHYTWSKAMDTGISDLFNFRTTNMTDVQNPKYDYSPSDFDVNHRFVANVTYELPFMKKNRWIGGWSLNSIMSMQSGIPFSVYASSTGYDANKDGRGGDRLVPVGVSPVSTLIGHGSPADGYFDKTKWTRYTCPASVNGGLWCDPPMGRNAMRGPGNWGADLGLSKKFKINERAGFTFQANFFNVFNHAKFGIPVGNQSSTDFGRVTTTARGSAGDMRVTQLALRFDW